MNPSATVARYLWRVLQDTPHADDEWEETYAAWNTANRTAIRADRVYFERRQGVAR